MNKEFIFKRVAFSSATLILVILVSIFVMLFISAKPAMQEYGWHFLVDSSWGKTIEIKSDKPAVSKKTATKTATNDSENLFADQNSPMFPMSDESVDSTSQNQNTITKTIYGGYIPIIGTILSTLIAMIFSVPIAMGISIFLSEIAPKFLIKPVGLAIELLAAIPSIIYGMWGLFYFAPIVQKIFGGNQISILTAGLVLGIMILPFMAAITRDAMNTTPSVLKESAYSLGATKFEVVKDIIFPYAKVGIIGSIILSLGRALGETMAVAFLIGSVFKIPGTLTSPTISIPVVLANNFGEAGGDMMSALFYLAFVLFVFSFIVIGVAKFYFLKGHR
ncbi:MAG: phosphate ABC transporter permease subunit PstC [Sulfurospirillaceae bacterium]|nr:phosphate ABC transporter permease subunit PstC [Sulfurospirillaceae bacterium]